MFNPSKPGPTTTLNYPSAYSPDTAERGPWEPETRIVACAARTSVLGKNHRARSSCAQRTLPGNFLTIRGLKEPLAGGVHLIRRNLFFA